MTTTRREVKVGAFVLAGLIVVGIVVFMIGDERQLFERKVEYQSVFEDVQGLTRGSPVRMGGVSVGSVLDVGYSEDPNDPKLYVTMTVVRDEARRIRADSTARIENRGLLGDKMIVITIGQDPKVLEPGSIIKSAQAEDFTAALSKIGDVSKRAERVMENLERTTKSFSDEQFHQDVKSSVKSLSGILKSLDQGEGYAGRFLHDPQEADRLSRTISNLERATAELSKTSGRVDSILARVEKGPGFAHDVIYEEGPSKAIAQIGGAADEVRLTLKGVREGNGLAKSVIYGDEQSQGVMQNLDAMSRDLRQITADLRAGKGTLGALLVDPSVYEDIKLVLGNVGRNKALRALVRYSIQRDEKVRGVQVRDPQPARSASEPGPPAGREASSPNTGSAAP
jgi:phospholipid/cholesterol/gamma-HCH transport system substrate-binding protein